MCLLICYSSKRAETNANLGGDNDLLDFDLGPPAVPSEAELTPPPSVVPTKRRGRGDPDQNLPGKRVSSKIFNYKVTKFSP